jgi:hypothetical protein
MLDMVGGGGCLEVLGAKLATQVRSLDKIIITHNNNNNNNNNNTT